jgi:hypothetical protein
MDEEKSEISLLIGYCPRQGGFPMQVADSSVGGGAWQFSHYALDAGNGFRWQPESDGAAAFGRPGSH